MGSKLPERGAGGVMSTSILHRRHLSNPEDLDHRVQCHLIHWDRHRPRLKGYLQAYCRPDSDWIWLFHSSLDVLHPQRDSTPKMETK